MDDILQDIPDEDVPLLSNLYKDHQNEAPHVYSLLNTYMAWKNKKPNSTYMSLFGVNNEWLKTGTFILLFEYACNNSLVIYSLQYDCQTLFKSLTQTKRIDWEKRTIWYPIMAIHIPVVYNILKKLDKWPRKITSDKMWMLDRERVLKLEIQCPDEVCIRKLNQSHIPYINSVWPHRFDGSLEYLSIFAEMNNCFGVFLKSNDRLVSWAFKTFLGHVGIVQTDPQHTRKGYATLAIMVLAKDIAEEGHFPVTDIVRNNLTSERLFQKLGFRAIDASMYFESY